MNTLMSVFQTAPFRRLRHQRTQPFPDRLCWLILLCIMMSTNISSGQSRDLPNPIRPFAEPPTDTSSHFTNGALRLEFVQTGAANDSHIDLSGIFREPHWGENPACLNTENSGGRVRVWIRDVATGQTLGCRHLDTMYIEYATTEPAKQGVYRDFEFTVRLPMPRQPVHLVLEQRNSSGQYEVCFESRIDAADPMVQTDSPAEADDVLELLHSGDPKTHVDVAFLAEGYTADQQPKFQADVRIMLDCLFANHPFKAAKDRFNVYGIFRASKESGTDEPQQNRFRDTALNSSFNIFGLDRYLLIESNHTLRRMAAQVPYDAIVVLVNSARFGGGAIGWDYCACTTDHAASPLTFLHEFGHSFAGLADEYTGDVSYSDMYPAGVEPFEPNITRETDGDRIKWRHLLTPGVPLPTPSAPADQSKAQQLVGAFEGGGYLKKGMFRPEQDCLMGSLLDDEGFCAVCSEAITRRIEQLTGSAASTVPTDPKNSTPPIE
jgi:hypothetical protein